MTRDACFPIIVLLCLLFPRPVLGANDLPAQPAVTLVGIPADTKTSNAVLPFSISAFIDLIRERNTEVLNAKLEKRVAAEKVKSERSIFEPQLIHSYQYQDGEYPLSTERANDILGGLASQPDPDKKYSQKQGDLNLALKQLLPTGGEINLSSAWQDLTNDSIKQGYQNRNDPHEHSSNIGLQLRQPLLKNAGIEITMAGIHLAEKEEKIAMQELRQQWMKTVYKGLDAYWDLYLSIRIRDIQTESVSLVGRVLEDNRRRVEAGKMAETELSEAESGLILRKVSQNKAKQKVIDTESRARSLISSRVDQHPGRIQPTEKPFHALKQFDFATLMTDAISKRPVYQKLKYQAEQAEIRLMAAKNMRWPQLDLIGSYKKNGLGLSPHDSLDQMVDENYNTWAVGIELTIPLQGGIKSKSELAAANYRKRQMLLNIHYAETSIANGIHAAMKNVSNQWSEVRLLEADLTIKKNLLNVEMTRLDTGHSTTRRVLEREDDVTRAKSDAISSLVEYQKALAQLAWISGGLIEDYPLGLTDAATVAAQ